MGVGKWLLIALFLVRVEIPFGLKVIYSNVQSFELRAGAYILVLATGKRVWVPTTFTIIQEK